MSVSVTQVFLEGERVPESVESGIDKLPTYPMPNTPDSLPGDQFREAPTGYNDNDFDGLVEQIIQDPALLGWIRARIANIPQFHISPEDVLQTTALRMIGRSSIESVGAYKYVAAASIITNLYRRSQRDIRYLGSRAFEDLGSSPALSDSISGVEDLIGQSEVMSSIATAMKGLTPQQRKAVLYRHYLDLDVNSVAELMGVKPGTVKMHTNRGLDKLRKTLSREDFF